MHLEPIEPGTILALEEFGSTDDSRSLRRWPSMVSTLIEVTLPALLDLWSSDYLPSHQHQIARIRLQPLRKWNEHAQSQSHQQLQLGYQSRCTGQGTAPRE
jgi:hypothetical protein